MPLNFMKTDTLTIEILPDGTLKVETDEVSAPNHVAAENIIKEMFRMQGGAVDIKHKHGKHGHSHSHGHGQNRHDHIKI